VIREDEKLGDAFNEIVNKLKELNEKLYKQAKKKNYFNNCFLIEYILRLLNIGILPKEAINDLFDKIKSVEDINSMFDYMDRVNIFFIISKSQNLMSIY
jgi:predicted nucleic acid-binding protein